jgi:hypothetical protein
MKKLLTIAALVGATSLSFGQGYVQFVNTSGSRFSTNAPGAGTGTGFVTVGPGTTVGQFYFALFAAPSTQNTISTATDPTLNGWTFVHMGTNTSGGGRISGNDSDSGQAALLGGGFAAGQTYDFAVAGWSASIGTSWAQAQAWWNNGNASGASSTPGYFGINSTVANDVVPQPALTSYPGLFGTVPGTINGWGLSYFQTIPEPSSFALAGLGAAALLIFRRRKAEMIRN